MVTGEDLATVPENVFTPWRLSAATLAVIVAGAVLRAASAGGDLWVDEIWSLNQLAVARAAGDTETWAALFLHDNTHPLNTAFLALAGPEAPPWAYRLLSVVSGVGALVVAWIMGARHGPAWGLVFAGVVAASYPLIHYAGEARGYGPMLFFAFAATHALALRLESPDRHGAVLAVLLLGGVLSHLTFALAMAGLAAWALLDTLRRHGGSMRPLIRALMPFAPAAVYLALYAVAAVGNMVIGGDNFEPAASSVAAMGQVVLGLDPALPASAAALAAMAGLAVAGVVFLWRRHRTDWPLYLVVVIASPASAIVVETAPYVLPRYFLIGAPFALLLALRCAVLVWADGARGARLVLIAVLVLYVIGNGTNVVKFLNTGRGGYGDAITAMAERAAPSTVSGSPRFSVGTVFRHHARRLGLEDRLRFVERPSGPTDWIVIRPPGGDPPPALDRPGARYALFGLYPHWGLSGDTWAVYRRRAEQPEALSQGTR